MSPNHQELVTALAAAIKAELASLTVPEEMHREHHEFIKEYIEERRVKKENREKLKTHVLGWGIITLLGSIGTGVYHAFLYLREHLK